MKNKALCLLLLPLLLSCAAKQESTTSAQSSQSESSTSIPSSIESSSEAESSPSEETFSSSSESTISSSSEESASSSTSEESSSSFSSEDLSSSESSSSSEDEYEDGVYHFYCVNDFHGSIVEQYSNKGFEAGIAKYFGRLKQFKEQDPDHTIILSAGDMFQGSIESNSNFGQLVIEAMNDTGFDAMELGNHEFDYGVEHLLDYKDFADFPILGGNVMCYDNGPTDIPWNDGYFPASTVLQRGKNKIGIVGMIGENQTTSITSRYVEDMAFPHPGEFALQEAEKLREEGCDIVVYLLHDKAANAVDYAADKTYFDGVFTGHTHSKDLLSRNGVPFVQSYCNGTSISHFDITIANGVASATTYEVISAQSWWDEDEDIAEIRDSYLLEPEFAARCNAIAGTVINGSLSQGQGVAKLAADAIYDHFGNMVDLSMNNSGRAALSGEITYRDIYKALPFTNHIVIATVTGADINRELQYNPICSDEYTSFEDDQIYTIATSDYLLFHQNENKRYDYFASMNTDPESKVIADYEIYPYDLVFDYVHDTLGGVVNASLY